MDPDYRFNDVDVIIKRGTMMTLIQFAQDLSSPAFAMTLDVVGNTLMVGRRMKTYMGDCTPGSYGSRFEAECSAQVEPDLQDAEGHQRVLLYSFGGLKITVKLKVDAYLSSDGAASADNLTKPINAYPAQIKPKAVERFISHDSPQPTIVFLADKLIPHERTIELKSNKKQKHIDQMWLGRTPNVSLDDSYKKDGLFRSEEKHIKPEEFIKSYTGNAEHQIGL